MSALPSRPDDELKKLAQDAHDGLVFTDRHLPKGDSHQFLATFMVLALMDPEKLNEVAGEIGMVYEYLDKAGPRSVNGYPSFFSCNFLNKSDTEKFLEYVRPLQEKATAVPPGDTTQG